MKDGASEAVFQQQVVTLAKFYGWMVYHPLPGMNARGRWMTATQGDTGWPDLVLVHPNTHGGPIFAELKSKKGRVTDNQKRWLRVLLDAGCEVYIWRPDDLDDIHRRLQGRTHQEET
jgi:hypothetical protein